ncbi:MAG: hypothetical protein WA637_06395, partial [Terriglobales bacterium]
TDAAVLVGAISSEQVQARSIHGTTHLSSADFNPNALRTAGLRLLEAEDRTASLLCSARGRRVARDAHRPELECLEGPEGFAREQRYLETIVTLAQTQALSRWMYLSERV